MSYFLYTAFFSWLYTQLLLCNVPYKLFVFIDIGRALIPQADVKG